MGGLFGGGGGGGGGGGSKQYVASLANYCEMSLVSYLFFFIPRPKGSGDIAMSLASVLRLSVRPYVRP